jgi:hypothetical protein
MLPPRFTPQQSKQPKVLKVRSELNRDKMAIIEKNPV